MSSRGIRSNLSPQIPCGTLSIDRSRILISSKEAFRRYLELISKKKVTRVFFLYIGSGVPFGAISFLMLTIYFVLILGEVSIEIISNP